MKKKTYSNSNPHPKVEEGNYLEWLSEAPRGHSEVHENEGRPGIHKSPNEAHSFRGNGRKNDEEGKLDYYEILNMGAFEKKLSNLLRMNQTKKH